MKKKFIFIFSTFLILLLFLFLGSTKVSAAENKTSEFDTVIQSEVENYVRTGKLERWHQMGRNH